MPELDRLRDRVVALLRAWPADVLTVEHLGSV
jgi:hypothetical protein